MIADVAILASLTYVSREVGAEKEKIQEVELHVIQEEHEGDKAAKKGQSAAVRQRTNPASHNQKSMKINNNHRKENHFNIQQPAGRK
jgi:hypothetical protein